MSEVRIYSAMLDGKPILGTVLQEHGKRWFVHPNLENGFPRCEIEKFVKSDRLRDLTELELHPKGEGVWNKKSGKYSMFVELDFPKEFLRLFATLAGQEQAKGNGNNEFNLRRLIEQIETHLAQLSTGETASKEETASLGELGCNCGMKSGPLHFDWCKKVKGTTPPAKVGIESMTAEYLFQVLDILLSGKENWRNRKGWWNDLYKLRDELAKQLDWPSLLTPPAKVEIELTGERERLIQLLKWAKELADRDDFGTFWEDRADEVEATKEGDEG